MYQDKKDPRKSSVTFDVRRKSCDEVPASDLETHVDQGPRLSLLVLGVAQRFHRLQSGVFEFPVFKVKPTAKWSVFVPESEFLIRRKGE